MATTLASAFLVCAAGCDKGDAKPSPAPDRAEEAAPEAKTTAAPPVPESTTNAPPPEASAAKAPEAEAKTAAAEPGKPAAVAPAAGEPAAKAPSPTEAPAPEPPSAPEPTAVASAAPPPPEPPPPPPVVSPKVGEQSFSLWMQSSGRYKAGQQGVVEVVLIPKGEFHCNQEYPYKMKLGAAPAGVTYPSAIVRTEGVSVSPSRATMRVPFVPQNAGDARISGKFYFSVCTSEQCVIDNRDLSVTVKVE